MIIYVDLVFFLNIFLDFILLMSVCITLTRQTSIKRIFLGSLMGGMSTITLWINFNSLFLFLLKILLGIIMVIISFGYHNFKYTFNNFFYLCTISFSVGGVLYLLMDKGIYNYFILIIGFIVVCFLYAKKTKQYQENYACYYKVCIYFKDKILHLTGYLDTGNKLCDPYKGRPVILIDKKIKYNLEDIIYVPYVSLNEEKVLKCIKPVKIVINKKNYTNYLVGLSDKHFQIDGINCILHSKMKGEI